MARPLSDCVVAISGKHLHNTHAQIKELVKDLGGKVTPHINQKTTHLITATHTCTSVNQALRIPSIAIVELSWLHASRDADEKADEASHECDFAKSHNATLASRMPYTFPASSKRGADDASDDDSSGTTVKKQKVTDTTAAHVNDPQKNSIVQISSLENFDSRKQKETQKVGRTTTVHVDPQCFASGIVHVDEEFVVYDATLSDTNTLRNSNKFYRLQVIELTRGAFSVFTRWGRVGDKGATQLLSYPTIFMARRSFAKTFKEKTGYTWRQRLEAYKQPNKGKYTFLPKTYEVELDVPGNASESSEGTGPTLHSSACTLSRPVQLLMNLLFESERTNPVASEHSHDLQHMPLGTLSVATIHEGYVALKRTLEVLSDPERAELTYAMPFQEALEKLSNRYYTMIPHVHWRASVPVLDSEEKITKEAELLKSIIDMRILTQMIHCTMGSRVKHQSEQQFEKLGLKELSSLDPASTEFQELEAYLHCTNIRNHSLNCQVLDIFRLERQGESARFDESKFGKLNQNRRLLWHGSRLSNFASILTHGLKIAPPEAPINGSMFGKGIYLADMSSKSANYCLASLSNDTALLLLCEAELGENMLELSYACGEAASKVADAGLVAVLGKGLVGPQRWKSAACVNPDLAHVQMPDVEHEISQELRFAPNALKYNEYICYDVAQVRLRYLFRVRITNR